MTSIIGISPRSVARTEAGLDAALNPSRPATTTPPPPPPPTAPVEKPQNPGWIARAKSALGYKDGGRVRGPGTGRSDSIPARVSKGEYVLPADTAKKVGYKNLDALKSRTHSTPMTRKKAKGR